MALIIDKHVFEYDFLLFSLYKHLIVRTNFLECMVNEHVFMNLVSLNFKNSTFTNFETWQNSTCCCERVPHTQIG